MIGLKGISFWGMNIPKALEKISNETDKQPHMTEDELKIYNLARENTISLLEQLLDMGNDGNSLVFYNPNISNDVYEEEYDIRDIPAIVSKIK